MAGNFTITSTITNSTKKLLYPKDQHFWAGTANSTPGEISPGALVQGEQQATATGDLMFAIEYVDNQAEHASTRKFIAAFHISPPKDYGPYGSKSPQNYSLILQQDDTVKEVIVMHGFVVDAIGFVVADKNGATTTKMFGGNGGDESKIPLKSGEQITKISGTYGEYPYNENNSVVATLKIHTNLNPDGYGPYGRGELVKDARSFTSPSGEIIGFFGSHSNYLESIGIYLSSSKSSKAYAECGPFGPVDWNVVQDKLGKSTSNSVVYVDKILGGKVEATVFGNGNAAAIFSDN